MTKYYAGIGSRNTPKSILYMMTGFSLKLENLGYILRSGGAEGADLAFERGSKHKEIYLPWKGFNQNNSNLYKITPQAEVLARTYHPYGSTLKENSLKLMSRNCYQVLGEDLNTPVDFIVCWTPDGAEKETSRETGGTGQAIRIAVDLGIRVYNLNNLRSREELYEFVNQRT